MAENDKDLQNQNQNNENQDYIDAINKLKENTVDKDKYMKLKEENKKLLESLVNGEDIAAANTVEKVDVGQLRQELYGEDSYLSNLDYVQKTLQLREAIIEGGGRDPFLPNSSQYSESSEDIEKALAVADVLQQCVDYAEGNNDIFTLELQRRMNDVKVPVRKNNR